MLLEARQLDGVREVRGSKVGVAAVSRTGFVSGRDERRQPNVEARLLHTRLAPPEVSGRHERLWKLLAHENQEPRDEHINKATRDFPHRPRHPCTKESAMKAAVYHKPKDIRVETVDDPQLKDSRDAILRVTATAICGSDLHIYNGAILQPKSMVLGHEFMGIVEEVGRDVTNLKKGDRVVVPFPIACGRCWFCEHSWPTQCENSNPHYGPEGGLLDQKGAALFGYTDVYGGYDGGQAEYVRVPFADYGPRKVSDALSDEQVLFLTDILPTAYSGIHWADLKPGESVAVFGCGPVGLMTMKVARKLGAGRVIGVDILPYVTVQSVIG